MIVKILEIKEIHNWLYQHTVLDGDGVIAIGPDSSSLNVSHGAAKGKGEYWYEVSKEI